MVTVVALSVLLYCDLPPNVKAQVEGLIAVLSAAIWLVSKVIKK